MKGAKWVLMLRCSLALPCRWLLHGALDNCIATENHSVDLLQVRIYAHNQLLTDE